MKRAGIAVLSLLAISLAIASSVHFKSGPFFNDLGVTLSASGSLAGLGNQDVTIQLTATGTPTATCVFQGGQVVLQQTFTL